MSSSPKPIMFFCAGSGSGGAYRALAFYKAFIRSGLAGQGYSFHPVLMSDYHRLLKTWRVPNALTYPTRPTGYNEALSFLTQAIEQIRPAHIISNYHHRLIEEAVELARRSDVYAAVRPSGYPWLHLLLRRFKPGTPWSPLPVNPSRWTNIIGIEPGVEGVTVNVPPVLAVSRDEVLGRDEARTKLLQLAGQPDNGLPLVVVAHNGHNAGEMLELICQTVRDQITPYVEPGRDHQLLYFSQCPDPRLETGVSFSPDPLARLYQGIDWLVAAPGYNTYWEWQLYSRPDARASWIEMAAHNDDFAGRIPAGDLPNGAGADEILRMIIRP